MAALQNRTVLHTLVVAIRATIDYDRLSPLSKSTCAVGITIGIAIVEHLFSSPYFTYLKICNKTCTPERTRAHTHNVDNTNKSNKAKRKLLTVFPYTAD